MKMEAWMTGALLFLGGCTKPPTASGTPKVVDSLPPELVGKAQAAEGAMQALQVRLFQRLTQELERGGPAGAVTVCRDEAQALTAEVAKEQGIEVGRTSYRLRNPKNAPRPWAEPFVTAAATRKSSEVKPLYVDLGDRLGLLRPIPMGGVCMTCHGAPDSLPPEVVRVLKEGYPEDRAVGFAPGDVRGFFWAEVRK
ncbi:Tll0287-like domain-containing protein [Hyalangium gracile]|uniref:Tll0287-like domain-containing protein n=1 Tax=Hyalangium gracile TaxID=394092 RepID=UPI001CCE086A|nr:DUF3365 domain-containing protein [Hyalangium gracile]